MASIDRAMDSIGRRATMDGRRQVKKFLPLRANAS
jgi:hypothetical protein